MASEPKTIAVVGVGRVGLPTAVLLARAGHHVIGIDIDAAVVQAIEAGVPHVCEPELQDLMADPAVRRNLRGSAEVVPADVYLIAVPTPLEEPRKTANLSMLRAACTNVARQVERGTLVIVESTVPPGTSTKVVTPLLEQSGLRVGADIRLAHCPERVLPGRVIWEIVHNCRIIGGVDEASQEAAVALYGSICRGEMICTDLITAEICKLIENTYRDVNIALANELAMVCATLGVDVHRVIDIANRHPRVNLLRPGIGVGGHCIPIDPWFIAEVDPQSSVLTPAARRINDAQPARIAGLIRRAVADLSEPRILLIGATYKANIYDLRKAPSIEILEALRQDGYDVRLIDPLTTEFPARCLVEEAAGCDCVAILVPHQQVLEELEQHRQSVMGVMRTPRLYSVAGGVVAPA